MAQTSEPVKQTAMYLEDTSITVTEERWCELMKGAKRASYKRLVARIKREMPELYNGLALDYYNPYDSQCKQTKTHYILVSSMIEYFIHK